MKWTFSWLKDYLKTDRSASEIADKLTQIGLEIEGVTVPIIPIVAEIIDVIDVEGTHLHLLKVNDGKIVRQVVCGAPNVRKGLVSVLALPGSIIQGNEIKVGKFRGFESNGMMCSPKELDLGRDHDGIIELDKNKYKIGDSFFAEPTDAVFEAGITPNRSDYLSVKGIARDLAASGFGKLISSDSNYEIKDSKSSSRKVIIKNKDRCPVYNFAEIHDIKIMPSNSEISERLQAIGINPKNAPVDATNYICYDIGQPMHCFDADEISGDIIVRLANKDEKFTDLFDVVHMLNEDDLVIADDSGILALAGIVGGKRGMTTDKTKNIILESAYFELLGVRKTRHRLGLSTDSSYRFERGVDPNISGEALDMAIKIIMKECGGTIAAYHKSSAAYKNELKYDPKLFSKRTGIDLSESKQKMILEELGYTVSKDWKVIVPSWRFDVDIPEVLVSDIMRIYGYNNIQVINLPAFAIPMQTKQSISEFFANNRGLIEHFGYGFGNIDTERMVSDRPNIKIANPIIDFMNTARNSLIPNMIETISENIKRGYPDLAMFEIGTVFDGSKPLEEHKQLMIVRTGNTSPRHWLKRDRLVDVFDIKADMLAFFGEDNVLTQTDNPPKWAHPYKYGRLVRDGKILGEFGDLHPRLLKHWRIKVPVVIGLIDKLEQEYYKAPDSNNKLQITDFQPIYRDFSFVLNKEINASAIVEAARGVDSQIIDVREFDFFENSIAFTITILPKSNLSDKELMDIQNKVIAAVEALGAKIRDK